MMEPPPTPPKDSSTSKIHRAFSASGGAAASPRHSSDHRRMDLDVFEIAPPAGYRFSELRERKEGIVHEVIDLDEDEDSDDIMIIDQKVDTSNKGKTRKSHSNGYLNCQSKKVDTSNKGKTMKSHSKGYLNHQAEGSHSYSSFSPHGVDTLGTVNAVKSLKSLAPGSHCPIDVDSHNSNFYSNVIDVDNYDNLQAQFDKVDIPPGVEAHLPWFSDLTQIKSKAPIVSSSQYSSQMQPQHGFPLHGIDPYPSIWSPVSAQSSMMSASVHAVNNAPVVELSSSQFFPQFTHSENSLASSKRSEGALKYRFGEESSLPSQFPKSAVPNSSSSNHLHAMKPSQFPPIYEPPTWSHESLNYIKTQGGSNYYSNFSPAMGPQMGVFTLPSEYVFPWFEASHNTLVPSYPGVSVPAVFPIPAGDQYLSGNQNQISQEGSTAELTASCEKDRIPEDVLQKFRLFKQFDTIDDHSDHHYASNNSSMNQPPKVWAKRIQEEWKILEKDLPDTIFVRAYESRMDLLRAVIKGAEGTPYHDGLFFFDVHFPDRYPEIPPKVYYHSGGVRLNPNLYNCGKVCLSLLNTWSGDKNEMWIPGRSSMLQLLVSIQGLILNEKPYFNEPGYEINSGTPHGESKSLRYNEDTFILSLRTMSFTIRRPPKHFEDFVIGHFCERAHDVMMACKAYMNGAQVGSLVKGQVQNANKGSMSCNDKFKRDLASYISVLAKDFVNVGVKDCEKYLSTSESNGASVNHNFCVALTRNPYEI